jgi:hypothetical protein
MYIIHTVLKLQESLILTAGKCKIPVNRQILQFAAYIQIYGHTVSHLQEVNAFSAGSSPSSMSYTTNLRAILIARSGCVLHFLHYLKWSKHVNIEYSIHRYRMQTKIDATQTMSIQLWFNQQCYQ